jgi:hypothetical protein
MPSAWGATLFHHFQHGDALEQFKGLAGAKRHGHTLQNQLLAALESGAPFNFRYQDGLFQVINLVRTDNISTACEIFGNMLAPERWEPVNRPIAVSTAPFIRMSGC